MGNKLVAAAEKRRPPAAGMGRKKGSQNKMTKALKDMILGALSQAGGEDYLAQQALEQPSAFLALLGRVLPTTLAGDPSAPVRHEHVIERERQEARAIISAAFDRSVDHGQTDDGAA